MSTKLKAKIATSFDAALVLITIVCLIWMRLSSMMSPNGYGEYFKYYTVLSNVLLGVAATVSLPFDLLVALGKRQETRDLQRFSTSQWPLQQPLRCLRSSSSSVRRWDSPSCIWNSMPLCI